MSRRRITVAALTAAAVCALAAPIHAQDLRVTATTWPPYVDARLYQNGVAVALASAALERAGFGRHVTLLSWPQALDATAAGHYDVLVGVWYTEERSDELAFSEPFLNNEIKFLKRSDSDADFRTIEDLVGLRIGVVDDYAYSREEVDTTGIEITAGGSVRENIERLLAGDLDLVLADSRVAMYEINQLVAGRHVTLLRETPITRGLRIAVPRTRPDHDDIIEAFDAAVADMRSDGSYAALMASFRISQ